MKANLPKFNGTKPGAFSHRIHRVAEFYKNAFRVSKIQRHSVVGVATFQC
jgi:hypothetical protein